jgi:hypothetical protein
MNGLLCVEPSAPSAGSAKAHGESTIEWQQAQTIEFSGPTHKGLRV